MEICQILEDNEAKVKGRNQTYPFYVANQIIGLSFSIV